MWAHQPSPEGSQQFWVLKVTEGIAKSTATRAHMTTSPVRSHRPNQAITHPYTVRLTKRFHSPHRTTWEGCSAWTADQPPKQSSHTTPPRHRTKRDAKELPQGSEAWQENRSPELQCAQYLLEIQVWPIIPARVSPTSRPTPRHGGNSEATQRTWPDHRPGGQRPSNHPWVSVRYQWTPARHDLKWAPWASWEISPPLIYYCSTVWPQCSTLSCMRSQPS